MSHALLPRYPAYVLALGIISLLASYSGCSHEPAHAEGPAITGEFVASLRVNAPLPTPSGQLKLVRDQVLTDSDGTKTRVLEVSLVGSTVRVEADKGRIARMFVIKGDLATRDGLRIGTPAWRLAQLPGLQVLVGDGGALWVVSSAHCGLSFELDHEPDYAKLEAPPTDAAGLRKLPATAAIKSILVRGCKDEAVRR